MEQLKSVLGASDTQFNHSRPNNPQTSKFDLSRLINITANEGMIVPFDVIPTLPGDIIHLSEQSSLDTLPLVQPSLTGYKVLKHYYYMSLKDIWKGAKVFLTRGRSGNLTYHMPRIDLELPLGTVKYKPYTGNSSEYDFVAKALGSHSLASFLGVPSRINGHLTSPSQGAGFNVSKAFLPYTLEPPSNFPDREAYSKAIDTGFNQYRYPSALPFAMYQAIVKHNYVPQNLLQDNKALFPDEGDDDWQLPSSATITNFMCEANNNGASDFSYSVDGVFHNDDTAVRLDQLRYALFGDDYFTTALPWLQRGDVTTLKVDFTEASGDITGSITNTFANLNNLALYASRSSGTGVASMNTSNASPTTAYVSDTSNTPTATGMGVSASDNGFHSLAILGSQLTSALNGKLTSTLTANIQNLIGSSQLTANQLRELIAMSVWQERNARVDGSYNNLIYQHWLTNPHADEHKPLYIGGTADYVNFSTVIQNSASSDSSPLGSTAGFGSSRGAGGLDSFRSPDYGFVMAILIIRPDTYYQQGVEHFLCCENVFDDIVQPEFESLSPQPILNKELYVTGDDEEDDNLFAYQERYMYLKVRQNVNRGLFQCKPDKDRLFASFTQARWFSSLPKLSYQFLVMSPENMRRDFLAFPAYPTFRLQIASKVMITRKLSYTSEPNTFGF